jgi:hypothetical protein
MDEKGRRGQPLSLNIRGGGTEEFPAKDSAQSPLLTDGFGRVLREIRSGGLTNNGQRF